MLGQMMNRPLLISMIARHAEQAGIRKREIVSITADHPRHRYTYREAFARARKLANALTASRHQHGRSHRDARLERLSAFRDLLRRVLRRLRLSHDQSAAVRRSDHLHRQSRRGSLAVSRPCVHSARREAPRRLREHRALRRADRRCAHANDIVAECDQLRVFDRGRIAPIANGPNSTKNTASSLCYTSGTTGDPKGVLYSHRSTVLHCLASALPDARRSVEQRLSFSPSCRCFM